MAAVRFNYADVKSISVKNKNSIKTFVGEIFIAERKLLKELNYVFCSDKYLYKLNMSFLNHNFLTDVISFDLSEDLHIIGEVYVSIDRIKENCFIHSTTLTEEFLRVVFHGALHLCGYKDKKKSEITIMKHKEDYYLQAYRKINV